MPEELRPEAILNGHRWLKVRYYGETLAHFAQEIVLEFRTNCGHDLRLQADVCSLWCAVEV